ncbi:MAG TPA: Rrf2 family transcriptional regulator [Planctomycetota bacterium]|nr:Rrf2 family transcriptional regulator [Planctomycetota bacterium]
MISQTTEYALRAMVFLAEREGHPHAAQEIAQATHVPAGYLSKVLQSLVRANLLISQRGLGGGFSLSRSKSEISIYEVVQAVDPIRRIRSCPLELVAHGTNLCPLHRRLDNALALVEDSFKNSTLAEILDTPGSSRPLCPFPRVAAKDETADSVGAKK